MEWQILVLVALTVAVAGCAESTQNSVEPNNSDQTSTPGEPADTIPENTIYYTSSGFQPSDLNIQQGETVTWINNASTSMWVASDRHPTHTGYAGSTLGEHCQDGDQNTAAFDQCSSGERFSFTFEKTGEWSYHNHERAAHGGTITVE